jgi:hypothetical protein
MQRAGVHGRAVDDEPLRQIGQMWGDIASGAHAATDERSVGHGRDRPLAVRSGDVQRDKAALGMAERLAEPADIVKTKLDAKRFEREEPVQDRSQP